MRGRVADAARSSFELARWRQELSAAPPGWQRLTAGVTDDGQAVAVFRYDSEAAARSSGERPQQAAWRASVERQLAGPAFPVAEARFIRGGARSPPDPPNRPSRRWRPGRPPGRGPSPP
jgi:hypothetical protein